MTPHSGWLSCSLPAFPSMALIRCSSAAFPGVECMTLMMLPPFSRKKVHSECVSQTFLRKAPRAALRLLTSLSLPLVKCMCCLLC